MKRHGRATRGCLAVWLVACSEGARPAEPRWRVEPVGVELAKLSGWREDSGLTAMNEVEGGTALRLVREGAVAGAPRVEVILDKKPVRPTSLETYLDKSLHQMAALADSGQIHITEVVQRPVSIGPRRAYRVVHAYTMGTGPEQISVTQIATLLVVDGRGVTILAYGRTELFHPLADAVEQLMSSITIPADAAPTIVAEPITPTPVISTPVSTPTPGMPPPVEPIDLGTLGGTR